MHVGATLAEKARSEADVAAGRHPEQPFSLVAQPGVVDPGRAPGGKQALWGSCRGPAGPGINMCERTGAPIKRFAPSFRDLLLAGSVRTAVGVEQYNPDYLGGDISAGAATLRQTAGRPAMRWNPYRTPLPGVYLYSASAPPGGVHGMCGMWAAQAALRDMQVPSASKPGSYRCAPKPDQGENRPQGGANEMVKAG